MGGVIACDTVCLGVGSISSPLRCDKTRSSLVDEASREGIYDN